MDVKIKVKRGRNRSKPSYTPPVVFIRWVVAKMSRGVGLAICAISFFANPSQPTIKVLTLPYCTPVRLLRTLSPGSLKQAWEPSQSSLYIYNFLRRAPSLFLRGLNMQIGANDALKVTFLSTSVPCTTGEIVGEGISGYLQVPYF